MDSDRHRIDKASDIQECWSCVKLTDVLLPVAGDLAVDLVGVIFARGLSQTIPTVTVLRHTFPILRLSGAALGGGPRLVMFTTCRTKRHTWVVCIHIEPIHSAHRDSRLVSLYEHCGGWERFSESGRNVSLSPYRSAAAWLTHGVPQGSILGPSCSHRTCF